MLLVHRAVHKIAQPHIICNRPLTRRLRERRTVLQCGSMAGHASGGHTNTNRLAKEQSPYLLQHCTNPVDW